MANPILSSDLYQDDGAIQKAIAQLEAFQKEYLKTIQVIGQKSIKLETEVRKLNTTTAEQRQQIKRTATEADKLSRQQDRYSEALSDTGKELARLRNLQREQNKLNKLEAELAEAKEGSYKQLSAQYRINQLRLNKLSEEERKATKDGQKLERQTNDLRDRMKDLNKSIGDNTLNVGNYKDSVRAAIDESRTFGGALNLLAKTPILGVLGLIVGALAALFNAFLKSEKGAQLMLKVTGFLNGLMSQLVGLASNVASGITSAFQDPQAALQTFWESLRDNIVNRFKGLILLIQNVGKGLKALWQRDLDGLKDAASSAGSALVQLGTGLDADQQRDFAAAVRETTEEIVKETNAFIKLEEAKRRVRNANRELTKSVEQLITTEELYRATADDATKSFQEREEAADKAREALERRAKLEIQLAKNNLSLINQELDLRRSNGEAVDALLDRQLDAYREVIGAERDYTLAVRDNEQQRAELKQDRLERDLDILIDAFDNQKTINERLLRDDELTFSRRRELLEQTTRLASDSFAKQIETIQQFTGVAVDANELIAESDAVVLNQKIRSLGLSEIIEGRLLEIVRERRTATQDLAEAEKELITTIKKARSEEVTTTLQSLSVINRAREENAKSALAQVEAVAEKGRELLEEDASEPKSIYDLVGLNLSDDQESAFNTAIGSIKDQLASLTEARQEAADAAVEAADREVTAAENALNREIENRNAGQASRVQSAQRELELAKETQNKALEEQRKAQQAEQRLQTIQQAGNLITASSKIFSQVGNPLLAIPLIALMFGSFIATKVRANKLAKQEFAEGGLEILGGGTHASGDDTYLGFESSGKPAFAERGEAVAIINSRNTRKYRSALPDIINSLNAGEFERKYELRANATKDIPFVINASGGGNSKGVERRLDKIIEQGERQFDTDGNGKRIERYKSLTRYYS